MVQGERSKTYGTAGTVLRTDFWGAAIKGYSPGAEKPMGELQQQGRAEA